MAKSKKVILEKKAKVAPEFDKIKPEQRVKSIKDGKVLKKKPKVKKEVLKSNASEILKKDPDTKKKSKEDKQKGDKTVSTERLELERNVVTSAVVNLRKGINFETENNTNSKNLFDDELRYGLNVIGVKIPMCPPHTKKM